MALRIRREVRADIRADLAVVSSELYAIANIHAGEVAVSTLLSNRIAALQVQVIALLQMPMNTAADRANLSVAIQNLQRQVGDVANAHAAILSIRARERSILNVIAMKLQSISAEIAHLLPQ